MRCSLRHENEDGTPESRLPVSGVAVRSRRAGIRHAVLAVIGTALLGACGSSGPSTAQRDQCEATAGVGRCVVRHGKWVALGSVAEPTTTAAPVTTTPTTAKRPPTTRPPTTHVINGSVTVVVIYTEGVGAACSSPTGYEDIGAGTQVTVKNEAGTVIGSTQLQSGHEVSAGLADHPEYDLCRYNFGPITAVPDASFYGIEVAKRGQVNYSAAQMRQSGWHADQRVGS